MRAFLVSLVSFYFCFAQLLGQEKALFDQATEHYNQGGFTKALENYQSILDKGKHSAEVYFNMGNAHYKLENVAESIFFYEKALLLKPNDSEILNNLGYAQNMRLDAIEAIPKTTLRKAYEKFVGFLTYEQWGLMAINCMILFVMAFAAYYLFNMANRKRFFFIGGNLFLLLALTSFIMAHFSLKDDLKHDPGIVFSKEVTVFSEPNDRAEKIFSLHEGTKVNVLEKINDWMKIQLADGQIGWLGNDNVRLLKPL